MRIQNSYVKRNIETIAFIMLLFCTFMYNISNIYGFTLYPDEFGYWSYAAKAAGYDWSQILSMGSYYSYGYSLILFPVFILCKSGITAYRAAVTINFILLAVTFFGLKYLAKKLFQDVKEKLLTFFVIIAVFYPPNLYYAKTTMVETLLVTMYAVICVLAYNYFEKSRWTALLLLMLSLVYIHFAHMRTIALMAAMVLTLLCKFIWQKKAAVQDVDAQKQKRKTIHYIMIVGIAVLLFAAGIALKQWVTATMYAESQTLAHNDYAGQLSRIRYVFTLEGFKNLLISFLGKVLYLGLASFGTAIWGIWHALKKIKDKNIFWLFIFLSTLGATMVNAVYTSIPGKRVDTLIYGRYHEYIIAILMIAGLYEMWKSCRLIKGTIALLIAELPMLLAVLCNVYVYKMDTIHMELVIGMSYFCDVENFNPYHFLIIAYLFGVLLTLMAAFLISFMKRNKERQFLIILIVGMELALSARVTALSLNPTQLGIYRDTVILDKINQLMEDDRNVVYLDSGQPYISVMQFMDRDISIKVLEEYEDIEQYTEEEITDRSLVLIDYRDDFSEELNKKYEHNLVSGHFALYYN